MNSLFPGKAMLLLQQNNFQLSAIELTKYINDFKITKFCVGSIEQAKILKDINKDFEIIGSITMKVMPEELNNNIDLYKNYFDGFVLWFPYNRNIHLIQQLPKDFDYILLVNCYCSIYCQGTFHWLAQTQEEENASALICPNRNGIDLKDSIIIPPQHLYLFDEYISYYKLQGRETTTPNIINDVVSYNKSYNENFNNLTIEDYRG